MLELQLALEQQGVKSAKPHAVENPCIAFDFPKTSLILWYLRGIDSRMPTDTKISRCSSPLHKMLKMHTVGPLHPQIPNHRYFDVSLGIRGCETWGYGGPTVYLLKEISV